MKLRKIDKKVLAYLYNDYKKQHGSSVYNLSRYSIVALDDGLKRAVPGLYGSDPELRELKAIFKELSTRDLVNIHGSYQNISLTEAGFIEASKTRWRRFVEFFNSNPGLAIIISLVSLIVAVIALFKSTD